MENKYKLLIGGLVVIVFALSFVIVLNDIEQKHQVKLTEVYFNGRTDVLTAIGQELQQTGRVTMTLPVYNVNTNQTVSVNVVLVIEDE